MSERIGDIRLRKELAAVVTFAPAVSVSLSEVPHPQIGIGGKGVADHADRFGDHAGIGHAGLPVNSQIGTPGNITFAVDHRIKFRMGLAVFFNSEHLIEVVSDLNAVGQGTFQQRKIIMIRLAGDMVIRVKRTGQIFWSITEFFAGDGQIPDFGNVCADRRGKEKTDTQIFFAELQHTVFQSVRTAA